MINYIQIINQLFEIQTKVKESCTSANFERNFNRLFSLFEEEGYFVQDPTGEKYSETRTDCEASITGQLDSKLRITRTIKPIIYHRKDGDVRLLQKAVVIAENN